MKLMRKPAYAPTSPFSKGGLREIYTAVAPAKHLESPLPPFAKGGNSSDGLSNHLTMTNA